MGAQSRSFRAQRALVRGALREQYPALFRKTAALPAPIDRTALVVGRDELEKPVVLSIKARLEHMHIVGTTGGGKTKFMEHGIKQDIVDGRGVCVVDPHGNHPDSLYRSLLSWLDQRGYTKTRTIHLIDPNAPTHVTGLDPLALPSPDYDCTVIAEAMQEALERVWGEEDLNGKPTIQRVLAAVLSALTELRLTLAEARLLFDPVDRYGVRAWAIANVQDQEAREELEWLHQIANEPRGKQDFRMEVTGPRNRLAKLTRVHAIRAMVGQQHRTIDFRAALDEGHIILANLSPGPRASDKAVQLLGRLLTRMLFFHAVRRQHPDRPFFFYLDECHLYLSGDVSRMLAEARKYGVGCILGHQFLKQLELAGLDILDAVKSATNIKAVLRIKNPEEAAELADMVLRYDLEMPVRALTKPTVIGHKITKLKSESISEQTSVSDIISETKGRSYTESYGHAETTAETVGEGITEAESLSTGAADAASSGSAIGDASNFGTTYMMDPNQGLFPLSNPIGITRSYNGGISSASSTGSSSARASSSGSSMARSSSHATTTASSSSEGVAFTESFATSIAKGTTKGEARTFGERETLEPILANLPAQVHSLENVRYMAAQVLRNLRTGLTAISFVDRSGMTTAALRVAHVASQALPPAEFDALRERVFDASPSAIRAAAAVEHISQRQQALVAHIAEAALDQAEPAAPIGYRVKKKRPAKVK